MASPRPLPPVYCMGLGIHGECGNGTTDVKKVLTPTQLQAPRKVTHNLSPAVSIVTGKYCTAFVCDTGRAWGFGKMADGRLPVSRKHCTAKEVEDEVCLRPRQILLCDADGDEDLVRQLDLGTAHGVAVGETGRLWVWGRASSKALGLRKEEMDEEIQLPRLLTLPGPDELVVLHVACGHHFSLAVTASGQCFGWGRNSDGQLTLASKPKSKRKSADGAPKRKHVPLPVLTPREICLPDEDARCVSVACGFASSAVVDHAGHLWTWGANKDAQLGHGRRSARISQPKRVESLAATGAVVKDVALSRGEHHAHMLVAAAAPDIEDGLTLVYSCGDGYKHKLGLGTTEHVLDLQYVPPVHFDGQSVDTVTAGHIHSAAVAAGSLYTWGCGSDGRLGHPEHADAVYLYLEQHPRRVEGLPHVIHASAHNYHTAAICTLPIPNPT